MNIGKISPRFNLKITLYICIFFDDINTLHIINTSIMQSIKQCFPYLQTPASLRYSETTMKNNTNMRLFKGIFITLHENQMILCHDISTYN